MCKGTETIVVRDDRVRGLDIHSEEETFSYTEMELNEDLERVFCVVDVRLKVEN